MLFAISPEQKKFFDQKGYIEFENLLPFEDKQIIFREIERVLSQTPGHPAKNIIRSSPKILDKLKKRQIGKVVYSLLEKKNIRIDHDGFFSPLPEDYEIDPDSVGLLIDLRDSETSLFFFKNRLLKNSIYKESSSCYLLVIFSSMSMPNESNPLIYP